MISFLLLALTASDFTYDAKAPFDVQETSVQARDGVRVRDITYRNVSGGRTAAYLVEPAAFGPRAAILYVHWYGPHSSRKQFLDEAVTLAKRGAVSLLIDTLWSNPDWFKTREPARDYADSVRQVKDLRRALDLLLSQPNIDRRRVAFVGHDFGAMYGAVMGGVDKRPTLYVLQAGTTSFSDWFLLRPKLEGGAREKKIQELAPLDPMKYIGLIGPAPVLFQFAHRDFYVPKPKAEEFFNAAKGPKEILWYSSGHGLNLTAVHDRTQWLIRQLKLR